MRKIGMLAVMLALGVGCAEAHGLRGEPGAESAATELVDSAWMAGEMQTVGEFDADAFEIGSYYDGEIELHVQNDDGWAMTRLYVSSAELEPGAHIDSAEGDYATAIGCAGPEQWNYDWDGSADRVVIDVEQGELEGDRLVTFEVDYPEGQTARGGFVYHAY